MRRQITDLDPEDSDPGIEIRPEWFRFAAALEAQVRGMDYTGSKRGLVPESGADCYGRGRLAGGVLQEAPQ